jgi:hypothetical protein
MSVRKPEDLTLEEVREQMALYNDCIIIKLRKLQNIKQRKQTSRDNPI